MRKRLASDLRRNPRAPASSTSLTRASVSCIVKIRISTLESLKRICRVASTPLSVGRPKSRTATSGRVASASSTASLPSEASATTSQPACDCRIARNPARTTSWSSAIRIRVIGVPRAEAGGPRSGGTMLDLFSRIPPTETPGNRGCKPWKRSPAPDHRQFRHRAAARQECDHGAPGAHLSAADGRLGLALCGRHGDDAARPGLGPALGAGGIARRRWEGAAVRHLHPALWAYVALLSLFLLAPIIVVIVAGFTAGDFIMFPPSGFSLKWFEKVLRDPDFIRPLWNSLRLGVTATLVSTLLAVPAAIALIRGALPGRRAIETFLLAPLTVPTIILAVGLLFFAARIGLTSSFAALLAGHVVITVPYMLRTVLGVYAGMNREVEEAAQVLGARPWQVTWLVTLPEIRPGVIAGAIFSFLMSFDEVAVALLLTNSDTTTLPVSILSYLVYNYDPAVAAISTIQIAIVVVALVLLERLFGVKTLMFASR